MTTLRTVGLVAMTAVLSVSATLLAREVFSEEAAVPGAEVARYRSAVLAEDREYVVHLPAGYDADPSRAYPVLYVLDGVSQSGPTASSAALLARLGLMPSVIVVGVSSMSGDARNRDYTPPDMRLDTDEPGGPLGEADRFLEAIESELVPLIERSYRTTRPRMLAGWSRGGLAAVYSMIAKPTLFDATFAHSPALWREDDQVVGQFETAIRDGRVSTEFLYLSLGGSENAKMTASFDHMQKVLGAMEPLPFRWVADISAGQTHETNPQLSTPTGLCLFFASSNGHSCRPMGRGLAVED